LQASKLAFRYWTWFLNLSFPLKACDTDKALHTSSNYRHNITMPQSTFTLALSHAFSVLEIRVA
jgi:hypothetical protein